MPTIEVQNVPNQKRAITEKILRSLPQWFGIESSILAYIEGVSELDFWSLQLAGASVGFVAIERHNIHTAEIYVMGILPEHHRQGYGYNLITQVSETLTKQDFSYLMVKTLADTHPDPNYARTRKFYEKIGFVPLQVLDELWGKENPCLLMIKRLNRAERPMKKEMETPIATLGLEGAMGRFQQMIADSLPYYEKFCRDLEQGHMQDSRQIECELDQLMSLSLQDDMLALFKRALQAIYDSHPQMATDYVDAYLLSCMGKRLKRQ